MYSTKGFNAKDIEEKSAPQDIEEHPVLGKTYRVHLRASWSKTIEQMVRSELYQVTDPKSGSTKRALVPEAATAAQAALPYQPEGKRHSGGHPTAKKEEAATTPAATTPAATAQAEAEAAPTDQAATALQQARELKERAAVLAQVAKDMGEKERTKEAAAKLKKEQEEKAKLLKHKNQEARLLEKEDINVAINFV